MRPGLLLLQNLLLWDMYKGEKVYFRSFKVMSAIINGISRRQFLKGIGFSAAAITFSGCGERVGSLGSALSSRPNIVLIMADDMGYSDLGCYGSEINTPNIDSLAEGGMRFTQFYNAARCCPTRASLLTGLYPHQAGMGGMVGKKKVSGPYQGYLNDKCVTIAEVLGAAGFSTYMSGKWHVGEFRPVWPRDRGFDRYFGLISGGANYFDITKSKAKNVKRQMAIDDEPWNPPKEGFYMTDAITDNAVKMLGEQEGKDNPFFMYVAYTAPHWPLHALPEDIAKYKGKYMGGWSKLRKERYERMLKMGLIDSKWGLSEPDNGVADWDTVEDKELMDLKMAVYAAQIDRMDQGVGKIMDKIKAMGAEDNTLVLFLADNGACAESGPLGFDRRNNGVPCGGVDSYMSYGRSWANVGNTPFRMYKSYVHEGGTATPLIAYWPNVIKEKGGLTHQPGHIIDIMATCCDVAGAAYPEEYKGNKITPMEGKSLAGIFKNVKRKGHEVLCWEHFGNKAIRAGKWKLVFEGKDKWGLYDLEADRGETCDLAAEQADIAGDLRQKYDAWAERCGVNKGKKE